MNKELLLFIVVISKEYLSASDFICPHTHLQFSVTIFQFLAVSFSYVSTSAERMLNTVFEFTEPSGPFPADECDTSLLQLAITFLQTSLLPLGQTCHALFLSSNPSWFPWHISQRLPCQVPKETMLHTFTAEKEHTCCRDRKEVNALCKLLGEELHHHIFLLCYMQRYFPFSL